MFAEHLRSLDPIALDEPVDIGVPSPQALTNRLLFLDHLTGRSLDSGGRQDVKRPQRVDDLPWATHFGDPFRVPEWRSQLVEKMLRPFAFWIQARTEGSRREVHRPLALLCRRTEQHKVPP
jgi:hypothetical protein